MKIHHPESPVKEGIRLLEPHGQEVFERVTHLQRIFFVALYRDRVNWRSGKREEGLDHSIDGQEGHKANVTKRSERRGEGALEPFILQWGADEQFSDRGGPCKVVDNAFRAHHVGFRGLVTASSKIKNLEIRRRRCCTP